MYVCMCVSACVCVCVCVYVWCVCVCVWYVCVCPAYPRHFQGPGLVQLCESMQNNLQLLLNSTDVAQNPLQWRQDGLFSFCYSLLFR